MDKSDLIVQYCEGDQDITSSPYAEEDATEVRVWTEPGDLVCVLTPSGSGGGWEVSFEGARENGWFSTVQDAIDSL